MNRQCGLASVLGVLLLVPWTCWAVEVSPDTAREVRVQFVASDADEKGKILPGVKVGVAGTRGGEYEITGVTDSRGELAVRLKPGKWYVTYRLDKYVGVDYTETVVPAQDTTITTTLSLSVEASGQGDSRRIRIVLNWGSRPDQVKDADSHLVCACGRAGSHVWYQNKKHRGKGHSAKLDVDDIDWAGPETVTMLNPPPGNYRYWVNDFSGGPGSLGSSEVVVRVLFGDSVAGEFRAPTNVTDRVWRPFKEIVVDKLLEARIVPYTQEELKAGADRQPAGDIASDEASDETGSFLRGPIPWLIVAVLVLVAFRRKREQ